jgi:hypothetical protein
MTKGELRTALRARLDDKIAPYLWDDSSLDLFLNKAVDEANLRARLLTVRRSIPVKANNPIVVLDEDLFRIDRVSWDGYGLLIKTGSDTLDRDTQKWETKTNDNPTHYLTDLDEYSSEARSIRLYPIPNVAGTVKITAMLIPDPMVSDADTPNVDPVYHFDLIDWAAHLAYLTNDSDAGSINKAKFAADSFTEKFGPRPENRRVESTRRNYNRRVVARFI